MGMMGTHIGGLVFGFTFFLAFVLTGIGMDKIDITFNKSFEQEYNGCLEKLAYFERERQVVCEAQASTSLAMLSGFMAGGFSVGWLILFGYPFIKGKLEVKKK